MMRQRSGRRRRSRTLVAGRRTNTNGKAQATSRRVTLTSSETAECPKSSNSAAISVTGRLSRLDGLEKPASIDLT